MAKSNSDSVSEQRHERWRELLRRWRVSGLSQAAFCRQRKIAAWKFTWWKKRLQDASCGKRNWKAMTRDELFVPVQALRAPERLAGGAGSGGDVELTLRGGLVLRFGQGVDPARLAAIVKALSLDPEALHGEARP